MRLAKIHALSTRVIIHHFGVITYPCDIWCCLTVCGMVGKICYEQILSRNFGIFDWWVNFTACVQ